MDSTTPLSNILIRSPPLPNQQQYHCFQYQRPLQSNCSGSIAPTLSTLQQQQIIIPEQQSLQRKQRQTPLEVPRLQNSSKKYLDTTQQSHYHLSHALNERSIFHSSPPSSYEQLDVDRRRKRDHPQIWCGKGQTEPTVSKHVYNYAQRKSSSEKTPMCKVAELTRYNKLRHGYVLLDESGPAHKKKFTVKLILCPSQEFEGSGPSIKKAQQAAAQCALDSTTLPRPPPSGGTGGSRRQIRKEPCNAILLLNTVAAQLGIIVNYKEELIRHHLPSFKSSLLNFAHLSSPFVNISNNKKLASISTLPPNGINTATPNFPLNLCFAPSPNLFTTISNPVVTASTNVSSQHQNIPIKRLTSILDLSVPLSNTSPTGTNLSFPLLPNASAASSLSLFDYSYFSLIPSCFLSLPPSILSNGIGRTDGLSLSPSAYNFMLRQQQQQGFAYKVTIFLSLDSSEHFGFGMHLAIAKQKAAVQALSHLRPVLECYKRSKEDVENFDGICHDVRTINKFNSRTTNSRISEESKGLSVEGCSLDNSLSSTSGSAEDDNGSNDSDFSPALNALLNGCYDVEQQTADKVDQEVYKNKSFHARIPEYRAFRSRRRIKSVNVEFEVLAETGEPHNRVYTLRCRLISPSNATSTGATTDSSAIGKEYASEGKGQSKKAAKQEACYQLLEKVRPLLDEDPIFLASQIIRHSGAASQNQKRVLPQVIHREGTEYTKRKTIIKDKKMDPEYGHHINPVSRLIQIMQIRQEREPTFHFISEQGQNRHKEFTVSVHCMSFQEKGTGPNKKLAKRAAAEAMLARIGYVKSMPQPGKSLLKKYILCDQSVNKPLVDQNYEKFSTKNWNDKTNSFETFASIEEALRNIEQNSTEVNNGNNIFPDKNSFNINNTTPLTHEENNLSHVQESANFSPPLPSTRRRVTFNEHVSACPPPEDSGYPAESIAPLKSELSGRIRRRNRDSQRILSQNDNQELKKNVALFFQWNNALLEKRGLVNLEKDSIWAGLDDVNKVVGKIHGPLDSPRMPISSPEKQLFHLNQSSSILSTSLTTTLPQNYAHSSLHNVSGSQTYNQMVSSTSLPISHCKKEDSTENEEIFQVENENQNKYGLIGAKAFLNNLSKHFKFTVSYSDFPRSKNAADDEQCFTLLTVGLAKPIVCHGRGPTEVCAHSDAALNAIQTLLKQLGEQESDKICSTKN